MKTSRIILPILVASTAVAFCADDPATNSFLNQLSFSARLGFNIRAKFGPRTTPDGMSYNYIDGYVLPDSTGDFNPYPPTSTFPKGLTQNLGYDNSASQVTGNNTILTTRSAPGTDLSSRSFDDDPQLGAELTYTHELGTRGNVHYGIEMAANYMNVCLRDNSSSAGYAFQDAYPYFSGTTPPTSPTDAGQPYQGRFSLGQQAAFVIGDTPVSSTRVFATVAEHCQFDANLWGFRLGPWLEVPLSETVNLSLSGGLAVGLLDASASWSQTLSINNVVSSHASGSGSDFDVLWGGYVGVNAAWRFADRWSLVGGVQFQDLGHYNHDFAGQVVDLNLSEAFFLTFGLGNSF